MTDFSQSKGEKYMKVQFLSKGFEVSIQTNKLIQTNEGATCHLLFKLVNTGIHLYNYEGEYPYQSFKKFDLKQVVIREPENEYLRYVLYSLTTKDYFLLNDTLKTVEKNVLDDTNFEWVQEDIVFVDEGKLGIDMMPALVKTADSNFERSRLQDPLIRLHK